VKEALMKKRYGVPAALLITLLAAGAVAAAGFTYVYKTTATVQEPKSEQKSISFNVPAGGSFSKTETFDVALPGTYDLTYKLEGDSVGLLTNESATIVLDMDKDWSSTGDQTTKSISTIGGTVTFSSVSDKDFQAKITISANAVDHVLATASWSSGAQNLNPGTKGTPELRVMLKPTKA